MRRLALLLAAVGVLVAAAPAGAHPLGNFSINHLAVARVSSDGVAVRYVLDQAEIPTFQQRGLRPAEVLARTRAEVGHGLRLDAGGRTVPLILRRGGSLRFRPGQGGLRTTRIELLLRARVPARGALELRDATYPGRVGWKAVVVEPGRGTAVRSDVPSADPTRRLTTYPKALLTTPADRRVAHLRVRSGTGTVTAPWLDAEGMQTTGDRGAGDGFAGIFADAAAGRGMLALLLLAAFAWGAVHALSPGHGKAMVAAYLVGTRGKSRHALAMGLTVTATHTIGVFALGFVTLALSAYVVPEDLYPWLNLVSGLLVLGVGIGVLRARARHARAHAHSHDHHHHHHHPHDGVRTRSLVAMGASAGLIPCPSALVVLLGAIAQHEIGLGLVLIVAFSAGLAATLTGLGLLVVHARALASRIGSAGRAVAVLPALSAVAIVMVGFVLTAQAVPKIM
jgi:nickel/cobalt transporter (NicO) family protein